MDGNRRYAIIRLVFPSRISICCRHFSSPDRPVVPVTRHDKEITASAAISIHPSRISVLFINDAALLITPGLNLAAYWYKVYRSNCELARLQLENPILPRFSILQFYMVEIKQGFFFHCSSVPAVLLLAEFKYFKRCSEKSRLNIDQLEKKPIRVNEFFTTAVYIRNV